MRICWALIATLIFAAWFWVKWIGRIESHINRTSAITATLEAEGMQDVVVFPLSRNCFSFNAKTSEYRVKTGKVCLGENDE